MNKLRWLTFVAGALLLLGIQPAGAEAQSQSAITQVPRLHDLKRPAMTVQEWVSQTPSPTPDSPLPIQVTGVKLNSTDTGIEVILETSAGSALQPLTRSKGSSYIADIPNAQLRLPSGNEFRQNNPAGGINGVTVTNQDANSVRVIVTGTASVPTVELFDTDEGLIFGVTTVASSTQQGQQSQTQQPEQVEPGSETPPQTPSAPDETIEVLVTGEQETAGYSVPDASTATRTDTPIRDIPQSIQVVPQQVLEDSNNLRL